MTSFVVMGNSGDEELLVRATEVVSSLAGAQYKAYYEKRILRIENFVGKDPMTANTELVKTTLEFSLKIPVEPISRVIRTQV
jgi:hypothetical protein